MRILFYFVACQNTRVITAATGITGEITTDFFGYYPYQNALRCSWRLQGMLGEVYFNKMLFTDIPLDRIFETATTTHYLRTLLMPEYLKQPTVYGHHS